MATENKKDKVLGMFNSPKTKTRRSDMGSSDVDKIDDIEEHPGSSDFERVEQMIEDGKFTPFVPDIDPDYIQRSVDLLVANLISIGKIPFLFGNQGTGKSKLVQQLAARVGMPYFAFPIDGSIALQDVYGEKTVEGEKLFEGKFTYTEKLFLLYLQIPSFVCIEELPGLDPSFGFSLHELFQENKMYVHDAGKIYHRHPDCAIVCTGNYSTFAGVSPINPALFDRIEGVEVPMLSLDEVIIKGQYEQAVRTFLKKLYLELDQSNSKFKISFRRVDTYNKLVTESQLSHAEIVKVAFLNAIKYMEAPELLDKAWVLAKSEFGIDKSIHGK